VKLFTSLRAEGWFHGFLHRPVARHTESDFMQMSVAT